MTTPRPVRRKDDHLRFLRKLGTVDGVIALAGLLVGVYAPVNKFQTAAISFLTILVANTLTLMFEAAEHRIFLASQTDEVVKAVKEGFALNASLNDAPNLESTVQTLIHHMCDIYKDSAQENLGLFYDECINHVDVCIAGLRPFYNQRIIDLEGPNCLRMTAKCFQRARDNIFAISFASTKFWIAEHTKDYVEENAAAMARNVRLVRVFVLDSEAELSNTEFQKHVLEPQLALVAKMNQMLKTKSTNSNEIRIILRRFVKPLQQIPDISFFDEQVVSRWELRENDEHLDKSKLEWTTEAIKEAKHLKSFLAPRSQPITTIKDIPKVLEKWAQREAAH